MSALVVVLPFAMAALNRVRGGGWVKKGGSLIAAAASAALVLAVTANPLAAGLYLGMYIGLESFGWGKWLGAIPHWGKASQADYNAGKIGPNGGFINRSDGKNNGVHALANKIVKETKDFATYGKVALALRGALWWLPIFIMFAIVGVANPVLAVMAGVLLGAAMPLCYMLTFKKYGSLTYWGKGEVLYGFCQGVAMAIVLV